MKLMTILLKEGRRQDLEKKYAEKFSEDELSAILSNSVLQDTNYKYADFVLKNLTKNPSFDDIDVAIDLINDFHRFQSNLEKKDINQYGSFEELDLVLSEPKNKDKEKRLEGEVEKIYEDNDFIVIRPLSLPASCKYGAGTKWCVTQKNADHFQRYTAGDKKLYFILRKKGKLGQPFYKVAVHFDTNGNTTWWDAQDRPFTTDAINLFKEYNEELWNAVSDNFQKYKSTPLQKVRKIFDIDDTSYTTKQARYLKDKELLIKLQGYENIPDMPKHAMGRVSILLDRKVLDEYDLYIVYDAIGEKGWKADITFGEEGEDIELDLELDGMNLNPNFSLSSPDNGWENLTNYISNKVANRVVDSPKFMSYVSGGGPVWRADISYGYKFGKNKGLIKKMIDWLDSGREGTRLDFLTDIGIFEKIQQDGKTKYKRVKGQHLYNPVNLRGQYSSFFASAVMAGIIKNIKRGRKFIITKGPNFEAFKEGKLRAL